MNNVIAYDLLEAPTPDGLVEKVSSAIGRGWVPSGIVVKGDGYWLQAVVKFG